MKIKELTKLLQEFSAHLADTPYEDCDVMIRISDSDEYGVEDGDYLVIMDEKSILIEGHKDPFIIIVGDVPPE